MIKFPAITRPGNHLLLDLHGGHGFSEEACNRRFSCQACHVVALLLQRSDFGAQPLQIIRLLTRQ